MQRGCYDAGPACVVEDCQLGFAWGKEAGFLDQGTGEGTGDDFGVFVPAAHVFLFEEGFGPGVVVGFWSLGGVDDG